MKCLVISDLHGSLAYCKEALRCFKEEKCDKLLLLGDVLYHGPRNDLPLEYNPKEVIKLLNPLKDSIICVEGNCDAYVDQMVLEFPILKEACVEIDGIPYYMTHGHIHNPQNRLNVSKGVVLYGHTHVAKIEKIGEVYYINPGSTSIPKVNMIHSYAIIENKTVTIKDFEGNIFDSVKLD